MPQPLRRVLSALVQRARKLYEQMLGSNQPNMLMGAHNLAVGLRALDQYQLARQLDEDTLTRRWRVLGDDHPDTLLSALTSSPIYALWVKTKRPAT